MAEEFMDKVILAQSKEEIIECFPFMRYDAGCGISYFYEHLGLKQ